MLQGTLALLRLAAGEVQCSNMTVPALRAASGT
jgi:hypothetical protein